MNRAVVISLVPEVNLLHHPCARREMVNHFSRCGGQGLPAQKGLDGGSHRKGTHTKLPWAEVLETIPFLCCLKSKEKNWPQEVLRFG